MKSLLDTVTPIQKLNIVRDILPGNDLFPNNGLLPLLFYKQALELTDDGGDMVKELLETNGWTNAWVDSILEQHHFHSTAHEVLVALNGSARVQFGGPDGIVFTFERGDVVIIPAGVAHCKVDEMNGFKCLGAYPDGQDYDMNFGDFDERPLVEENIRNVALPENDPLYGIDGPLIKNWSGGTVRPTEVL